MHKKKTRTTLDYLNDIMEEINDVRDFMGPMDMPAFSRDLMTLGAVTQSIQNIGEAIRNIPRDIKERHSSIPWKKFTDIQNRFLYRCYEVGPEEVWNVAKNDLGPLEAAIANILKEIKND